MGALTWCLLWGVLEDGLSARAEGIRSSAIVAVFRSWPTDALEVPPPVLLERAAPMVVGEQPLVMKGAWHAVWAPAGQLVAEPRGQLGQPVGPWLGRRLWRREGDRWRREGGWWRRTSDRAGGSMCGWA